MEILKNITSKSTFCVCRHFAVTLVYKIVYEVKAKRHKFICAYELELMRQKLRTEMLIKLTIIITLPGIFTKDCGKYMSSNIYFPQFSINRIIYCL